MNLVAKLILNRTKLIVVRENLSKKYLQDQNITKPKIYVTADPAFLLNPISELETLKILTNENINLKKPIIGINPSGLISNFSNNSNKNLVTILSKTIDYLIQNLNVDILLIPHVYGSSDDRIIINNIFNEISNKSRTNIIKNEYSPEELKGRIKECDLFVGARMHATIASISMCIPTVGIAYSHKMHGIIGEMLGQEEYILDIEILDYNILISKINKAWNERKQIIEDLEGKVPNIIEKSLSGGKLVKKFINP